MAKKIILEPGRTFSEFSLLTGYTKRDCQITNISLKTKLAQDLILKLPLLSAAMTSVTGYELALALGKEGGIGILPARLAMEEQAEIVKKIKKYEMAFVEEPVTIRENTTIEEALKLVEKHGHSKIPVINRNNTFLGMFTQQHYWDSNASLQDKVTSAMTDFKGNSIPYCQKPNITVKEAKQLLQAKAQKYLVVLDQENRFVKLAFQKDIEKIKVGAAIATHGDWKKRVKLNIQAGVDLIVIDTSDAYSDFVSDVIKEYRSMGIKTPLCAGNIITYEGAMFLAKDGADILKVGMSSGSICTTCREKATGRAPMTALIEVARARNDHFKKTGKYLPLVIDGGISSSADMIIALTIADAVMMGSYFNRFYESAGEKLDQAGKTTRDENKMTTVATWGEGSGRAKNLDRYGHSTKKTFFEEGAEGTIPYLGRLKPTLKKDTMKIKAALSNVGCLNLDDFRKKAVIELNSIYSKAIISDTHTVQIKKGDK